MAGSETALKAIMENVLEAASRGDQKTLAKYRELLNDPEKLALVVAETKKTQGKPGKGKSMVGPSPLKRRFSR